MVLERGAGARRQDARGRGRRRAGSTPGPPSSPCAGCSRSCSPPPAPRWPTPDAAAGRDPRPPCLERDGERLDLFADRERSADAIGAFAGPAEARGYLAFCDARAAHLRDAGAARSSAPPRPEPRWRWSARVGLRGLGGLWRHLAVRHPVARARRAFPRPAAAPAVRPLRHLLRLLAVPGAGDADAGRPCRAGGRLAGRGRHAPARRGAGRRSARGRGARFRYGAEVARDPGRRAAAPPACGWPTASGSRPTRWWSTPTSPALAAGLLGPRRARAVPPVAAGRRARCRPSPGRCWRETEGFPLLAPQRLLLGRLRRRVRRHLRARAAARDAHRLCLRPGPRRRGDGAPPPGAGAAALPRQRAGRPATRQPLDPAEIERCETADLRPAGALRPDARAGSRSDGGDDAGGLRAPVPGDGRGALRPGVARLAGVFRRPGARTALPGLYLAGGSAHPGRGRADGGAVGPAGGGEPARGPRFDAAGRARTATPGGTSTR